LSYGNTVHLHSIELHSQAKSATCPHYSFCSTRRTGTGVSQQPLQYSAEQNLSRQQRLQYWSCRGSICDSIKVSRQQHYSTGTTERSTFKSKCKCISKGISVLELQDVRRSSSSAFQASGGPFNRSFPASRYVSKQGQYSIERPSSSRSKQAF
jgi:hypothetical protein